MKSVLSLSVVALSLFDTVVSDPVSDFTTRIDAFVTLNLDNIANNPAWNSNSAYIFELLDAGSLSSQAAIDSLANDLDMTAKDADFRIVRLVKGLLLGDASFLSSNENNILTALEAVEPFWVDPGLDAQVRNTQNFWTENHMIQWDSSAYLLEQTYPGRFPLIDIVSVKNRIRAFLELKLRYNFYELDGANYFVYTMAALLNLADYAADEDIRLDAITAVNLLLSSAADSVNDMGTYVPAQTRGNANRFVEKETDSNLQNEQITYLLTGKGNPPTGGESRPVWLAATDVENIRATLERSTASETQLYDVEMIGNVRDNFRDNLVFNKWSLTDNDITVFQLSANLFWTEDAFPFTQQFITDNGLAGNPEFAFAPLAAALPPSLVVPLTEGAIITEVNRKFYKSDSLVLTSFENYNSFQLGSQQYPWAATTGTAVITATSGQDNGNQFTNVHMPKVFQNKNAAVMKYDSSDVEGSLSISPFLAALQITGFDVVITVSNTATFDEIDDTSDANWIFFREGTTFLALYTDSSCGSLTNNAITCGKTGVYAIFMTNQVLKPNLTCLADFVSFVAAQISFDPIAETLSLDDGTVISTTGVVTPAPTSAPTPSPSCECDSSSDD